VCLSELRSYKQFAKHYFQTQLSASQPKVEVVQTKEEVQLNYPNSSILCKIGQNHQNEADFRIKLIGYYN
jgi:proline dehydrogenase